jgi:hypothetical protein
MKSIRILILGLVCMMLVFFTVVITIAQDFTNPYDFWSSSGDATFFMGLGITMCLIIFLIPLIIAILLCIWIYKDAEKRGKSGALWVLILILGTLFLNIIGLIVIIIVWLAVRPPEGGEQRPQAATVVERRCPNCGRVIPNDARVCPYCGKKFEE